MKWIKSFLAAVVSFTRIPIRKQLEPEDFKAASLQLPLLAYLIGLLMTVLLSSFDKISTRDLAVFLALVLPILISGAMHEDGLADFCDAIFGGDSPERRLEIMKDPHIGTFGVLSLVIVLGGSFIALSKTANATRPGLFLSALVFSRCLSVLLTFKLPYLAQSSSRAVAYLPESFSKRNALTAFWPLVLVLWYDARFFFLHGLLFVLLFFTFRHLLMRKLGGYTGDCLGAAIKIAELVMLFAGAMFWPLTKA